MVGIDLTDWKRTDDRICVGSEHTRPLSSMFVASPSRPILGDISIRAVPECDCFGSLQLTNLALSVFGFQRVDAL